MSKIKRKNKYIPNLAEFYFKPDNDWTFQEAKKMYSDSLSPDKNKIFYENCIQGMRNLPPESIDLLVADPPFGLSFNGKDAVYNRNSEFVIDGYNEVDISNYEQFSKDWIMQIPQILKSHGSAYIFSGWTNLLQILQAIKDSGLIIRNHIIWNYNFAVFTKRKFATSHYHILFVVKNEKKVYLNCIKHYETDTWIIPENINLNN